MLILFVIIGLAIITVSWSYVTARVQARDEQRLIDIGLIQKALTIYFTENGFYPYAGIIDEPRGMDNYLQPWPTPPPSDGSCSAIQNRYVYAQKSNGSDYSLSFCLGRQTNGLSAGEHVLSLKGIQ